MAGVETQFVTQSFIHALSTGGLWMTGALVGKVCAFPLCKILPKTSRGIYHPVTPLMQPYGVFVSNGTQGGGQVRCHAFNASLTHSRDLRHRAAGSCHFQRPRQLHPPRHDLCPHWLQVHSRARDDVCSCQCHPHSLIARSCQPLLTNMDEIHGGSPWGAGAFPLSLFTFSQRRCLQPSAMMIRQNAGHSHSFRHIFQRHGRSHAQSD